MSILLPVKNKSC